MSKSISTPIGATLIKADKIMKGNRIQIFRMAYYGKARGYEEHWDSFLVIRITKNKIQIHANVGTYLPKFNEDGELMEYYCRID